MLQKYNLYGIVLCIIYLSRNTFTKMSAKNGGYTHTALWKGLEQTSKVEEEFTGIKNGNWKIIDAINDYSINQALVDQTSSDQQMSRTASTGLSESSQSSQVVPCIFKNSEVFNNDSIVEQETDYFTDLEDDEMLNGDSTSLQQYLKI